MKMSRIVIILALAVTMLAGTAAWSQGPRHSKRGGGRNEFAGLNLTADQKAQVRTIHEQQRTKMQELAKQPLTRAEFRTQAAAIHKAGHDQVVNNVLTSDQRAQLAARHTRQAQRRQRSQSL
jgi:Spy/CpxP family protein refolding chaperone